MILKSYSKIEMMLADIYKEMIKVDKMVGHIRSNNYPFNIPSSFKA
jgi:hypothetical protein